MRSLERSCRQQYAIGRCLAALVVTRRPQIDDPVGGLDDLDHDHGIALLDQSLEHVEDVETAARRAAFAGPASGKNLGMARHVLRFRDLPHDPDEDQR